MEATWKNGKISLKSDSIGAASFDQNAFERIEFDTLVTNKINLKA